VPKVESWLTRLGARLSGRALPRTGNRTDRNMELAVPGALTLSVGASGDSRASNLYVLAGKGPSVTIQVLKSMASKPLAGHPAVKAFGGKEVLANPGAMYAEAFKKAVAAAAERGVPADQVLFVRATASLPVSDGAHWHYAFSIPGKARGRALIYADSSRFIGGTLEVRTSIHENAPEQGGVAKAFEPARFGIGVNKLDPEEAFSAARRAQPGMSAGAGVSLDYREGAVAGNGDFWYRFFDDRGAVVSVNARTSETVVDSPLPVKSAPKEQRPRWKRVAEVAGPIAFIAAIAASYYFLGHIMIDWLRQAEQQMLQQSPEFTGNGAMLGGTLVGLAGTIQAKSGITKTPDRWEAVRILAGPLAIIAAAAASYFFLGRLMIDWLQQAEQQLRQQGPDIGNNAIMFGGTLLAAAGTLRAVKKPKVGDDEIAAAAKGVVTYKGGVWSETEYNVGYYNAIDHFRKLGATETQIALFRKLCDEAPVIGGRFNPWSGD
jgi:hypothetical protein